MFVGMFVESGVRIGYVPKVPQLCQESEHLPMDWPEEETVVVTKMRSSRATSEGCKCKDSAT